MNNLKLLRGKVEMTQEQLASKLNVSTATIKKYEGDRQIPIEQGLVISDMFNVSLDWLYCKNKHMNERDTMTDIVKSLGRIFMISKRKTHNGDDTVLLMDSSFRKFLFDINSLGIGQSLYIKANNRNYKSLYEEKFLNNKKYLERMMQLRFMKLKALTFLMQMQIC